MEMGHSLELQLLIVKTSIRHVKQDQELTIIARYLILLFS